MLTIGNYLDFLDLSPYVRADYSLTLDGEEIAHGSLNLPSVPPHGFAKVPLALDIPEKGRCFLCVTYILTSPLQGLPAGHELGFDDIEIQTVDERNQKVLEMFESVKTAPAANSESENAASAAAPESKNAASAATPESKNAASATLPTVTESDTDLIIEGSSFAYTLDTLSGRFTSLVTNADRQRSAAHRALEIRASGSHGHQSLQRCLGKQG